MQAQRKCYFYRGLKTMLYCLDTIQTLMNQHLGGDSKEGSLCCVQDCVSGVPYEECPTGGEEKGRGVHTHSTTHRRRGKVVGPAILHRLVPGSMYVY